jgi:hypothetical protein
MHLYSDTVVAEVEVAVGMCDDLQLAPGLMDTAVRMLGRLAVHCRHAAVAALEHANQALVGRSLAEQRAAADSTA